MPSGLFSGPFSGIAAACLLTASLLAASLLWAPQLSGQTTGSPSGKSCLAVDDAAQPANANQDRCVHAHVYDVVELSDGTRFLDVCPPDIKDDQCRFTLLSLPADRGEMGDLGIVLSNLRQFHGGPEKFRPNPRLLRGFDAESSRRPIRDPNLSSSGRHRAFMNSHEQEVLPPAQKH
jgi:hypothetical protein